MWLNIWNPYRTDQTLSCLPVPGTRLFSCRFPPNVAALANFLSLSPVYLQRPKKKTAGLSLPRIPPKATVMARSSRKDVVGGVRKRPWLMPSWLWDRSKSESDSRLCVLCRDQHRKSDLVKFPCEHKGCRDCVQKLFETSIDNEDLFPPRCCDKTKPVTLEACNRFLKPAAVAQFKKKEIEYSTPASERIYCYNEPCSAFIPPTSYVVEEGIWWAKCAECHLTTCTTCKQRWHFASDCRQDPALQQLMELASTKEWKQCTNCRSMIEMTYGCNHMS